MSQNDTKLTEAQKAIARDYIARMRALAEEKRIAGDVEGFVRCIAFAQGAQEVCRQLGTSK